MSSTLEFRHLAIALPADLALDAVRRVVPAADPFYDWGSDGQQYLVFAEAGCSNVFDYRNRVARRWHLAAAGSRYQVLRTVAHVAADSVLSGGTCLHTRSRWTLPETYIATYRTTLGQAIDLASAQRAVPDLTLQLNLVSEPKYQHAWNARDEYRAHLRDVGRLKGEPGQERLHTAPLHSDDGVADLAWITSLGQDEFLPAWLMHDYETDDALDGLAARSAASRGVRKARG
jgi:hypothetical protein